jgi:hypothetical protein
MYQSNNWSDELQRLLKALSELESELSNLFEEDLSELDSAEDIIKRVFDGQLDTGVLGSVNIIPFDNPGQCCSTLLVIIGAKDSDRTIDTRILEAIEHLYAKCPGKTTNVVFWAAKWNSQVWAKHNRSFGQITVVLKPFLAAATPLYH